MTDACCSVSRQQREGTVRPSKDRRAGSDPSLDSVHIEGATFLMGTEDGDGFPDDREGPIRPVAVDAFAISRHASPNEQFARFIRSTSYQTDAEQFGWSFVFAHFLSRTVRVASPPPPMAPWWRAVAGASWPPPMVPAAAWTIGPTTLWCTSRGTMLSPTQSGPAAGSRPRRSGSTLRAADSSRLGIRGVTTSILTGSTGATSGEAFFPTVRRVRTGTSGPLRCTHSSRTASGCSTCAETSGSGAPIDGSWEPGDPVQRVMRGGSYLCHPSYCNRYRVGARSRSDANSGSGNNGLRVVREVT